MSCFIKYLECVCVCILFLFVAIIHSQTRVNGDVSGTWKKSKTPYIITSDLTVLDGEVLEIEPGVEIIFDGNYGIYVEGVLRAIGEKDDSIRFTGFLDIHGKDFRWKSINFSKDCDTTNVLAYCVITYGSSSFETKWGMGAISCGNSSPIIRNCRISNCSWYGISCEHKATPIIKNNVVSYCYDGISCFESSPLVSGNVVTHNANFGIYCRLYSNPQIENNYVGENLSCGVYCIDFSSPELLNNTINNNYHFGLFCAYSSEPQVTNCIIMENWSSEVFSYDTTSIPTISYCNIWDDDEFLFEGLENVINIYGNLSSNTLFRDSGYHLTKNSACVDAGIGGVTFSDIDGDKRPLGKGTDIGCDEFVQ
ncbi:right-handed parallel beta-helix repeat-containing protein [bacterium]|nr:right-handed parallel beta-helix repeat-containing protein [bacterium]